MEKYELQKLRDLPIEGVAQRLGIQVERHKCLCPFHDDHQADETGEALVQTTPPIRAPLLTQEGKRFDPGRYERYFERPWLNDEARKFLFEERRIDPRVVRWCRITSWKDRQGVPWLQTPYYDREGKLVGVQNRNLVKGGTPRFRFPQDSQCGIYNLPVLNLLKPGEALYITEGCSDCWAMLSAGHKAIAIPSATLLNRKDRELLSALNDSPLWGRPGGGSFHMFPDERLFLQLKELLPDLVHHQLPPDCKDFSEYYLKYLILPSQT